MALTAGTVQLVAQMQISGVKKAAQGDETVDSIPSPQWSGGGADNQSLAFGTGSGQCDIICCAAWAITAAGSITFDLFTGTDFPDVFGNTAAFRHLKAVYFQVVDGTGDTAGVTIGNAATDGNQLFFGAQDQTWTIYDGGPPFPGGNATGVVVDATHKNLKLANTGAVDATVIIGLAGTST